MGGGRYGGRSPPRPHLFGGLTFSVVSEEGNTSILRSNAMVISMRLRQSERMNHSLSAQISYYSALIQQNPDWQYAGVFADNGISGTSIAKRDEFKRMIAAAENGDVDIILILPFGFNDVSVKEMQSKPKRRGDVDAGNLLTENHLVKLGKSQCIGADCFKYFFLDAGAVALGGGGASPNGVVAAVLMP